MKLYLLSCIVISSYVSPLGNCEISLPDPSTSYLPLNIRLSLGLAQMSEKQTYSPPLKKKKKICTSGC